MFRVREASGAFSSISTDIKDDVLCKIKAERKLAFSWISTDIKDDVLCKIKAERSFLFDFNGYKR